MQKRKHRRRMPDGHGSRHTDSMIGKRIGVFRIDAMLGAGGMGEVYRAHDTALGRDVAIKTLPPAFTNDPERLVRLKREARMLAALNHPNIAAIHGLEQSDAECALVLELVNGAPLADLLSGLPKGSPLPKHARSPVGDGFEAVPERSQRDSEQALRTRVEGRRSTSGLPVSQALSIASQIALALDAAHQKGIV